MGPDNKVEFAATNHTYAVKEESLSGTGLKVTHRALNDDVIEGLRHETKKIISVEFNPEAAFGAGGQEDNRWIVQTQWLLRSYVRSHFLEPVH